MGDIVEQLRMYPNHTCQEGASTIEQLRTDLADQRERACLAEAEMVIRHRDQVARLEVEVEQLRSGEIYQRMSDELKHLEDEHKFFVELGLSLTAEIKQQNTMLAWKGPVNFE